MRLNSQSGFINQYLSLYNKTAPPHLSFSHFWFPFLFLCFALPIFHPLFTSEFNQKGKWVMLPLKRQSFPVVFTEKAPNTWINPRVPTGDGSSCSWKTPFNVYRPLRRSHTLTLSFSVCVHMFLKKTFLASKRSNQSFSDIIENKYHIKQRRGRLLLQGELHSSSHPPPLCPLINEWLLACAHSTKK